MAKINTSNYQPVTSWNGTQDLLIVEQPDGTKVATPEQVKQYVESGNFTATGEITDGHGNILADMAKKADITTVTIPAFTPSEAGWRRICKIKPVGSVASADGLIYVGGGWTNGQPPSASAAVSIMATKASLTLLSSTGGDVKMTAMRLVHDSVAEYWLDVYFVAYSANHGPLKLTFTGDIAVSDIQNPISITTDATAATAEISLNQKVSGIVLTKNNIQSRTASFPPAEIGRQSVTVTFPTAFDNIPQVMVAWDDTPLLQDFFKYPIKVTNITKTGFTVIAERIVATNTWYFKYIAVDSQ